MASSGLLIVNADDWGHRPEVTDAILDCFETKAISSTTGMVFMADSERAARIAVELSLPVGLHLNLTTPFTGLPVKWEVRARHDSLRAHFARGSTYWRYSPRLRGATVAAIRDQLDEFERLYGQEPTHIDGHHHVQARPDVLLSPAFPRGTRLRPAHSFPPGRSSWAKRLVRRALNIAISGGYATPHRFYSIRDLHPAFGGCGLEGVLNAAQHSHVEIMVHPSCADELDVLRSAQWSALLRRCPVGSYSDLTGRGFPRSRQPS